MKPGKFLRYATGIPVFGLGFALIVIEVIRLYQQSINVHLTHVGVGLALMYIGGAIINTLLAETIADNLVEKIPLLKGLPGGRRKTDPPSSPPTC